MTTVESNKLPIKMRPTLRLKSSTPPPEPAPVPKPAPPPPRPAPAATTDVQAVVSKKAARKALWVQAGATRRELIRRFPKIFRAYRAPKVPMKIGTHDDVVAACPDIDAKLIGFAIAQYVNQGDYRDYLVAGATRFDLEGNAAGVVTEDQCRRPKAITPPDKQ
jgi:hypothetical protein